MKPSDKEFKIGLVQGQAILDRCLAGVRDIMAKIPTRDLLDVVLVVSVHPRPGEALDVLKYAPQYIQLAAAAAIQAAFAEEAQRRLEVMANNPEGENEWTEK